MKNDFEIVLPTVDSETGDYYYDDADKFVIIPIEKYDQLISECGKLETLRTYLSSAKKPTFATIEAMLGIERSTRD